jgi:AcrR family transcriptional regulator
MTAEQNTRSRILEAALERFANQGYHATKVADIVESSRTSKGAVYFHFPSKQDIFLGLVDQFAALLEGRVQEALAAEESGVERVDAALTVVMNTFTRYRQLAKIFLIQAAGLGREFESKRLEIHRRFIALIQDQLEQALEEGDLAAVDPEVTAYAWMGAVNELVISWVHDGHPDPEQALPELRGLLLRGIGLKLPEDK